ncbi:ATP-grasp domain-containing protein [uncultured Methanobrevibacter sp.]|uniref:ATP-grasp domain-containing protein n=1 Tax=uncultured Methanobrevibacter sp. TaxID=253161 RepID=UPI0025CF2B67|nr:ATP-grasp domain-containing protein [uncultured Methanobrevibacter sp.]
MKKLLLIGINTRSMLNSALKLNYEIYSTSYFSTSDMPTIKNQKIILNEKYDESCGLFEDNFNSENILEISKDYIDEVDYIIPISGVSPSDFKKKDQKKILGTTDVESIENKYKFYKKIKNSILTPETFKIKDIADAFEINKNYPETKFILKPLKGSGGYNINLLSEDIELNNEEYIIQEYIDGINLSSSILANKNNMQILTHSRLLTVNDISESNSFKYIGNILPLTKQSIITETKDIKEITNKQEIICEELAKKFNLIGSNGIDYILNENGLYALEINPRLQGTYECIEKSFGINMLDAHIKTCQGQTIEIPKAKYYSYKKIIYSPTRMKYNEINENNIFDLPHVGSITEKGEPLLTIIDKDKDFEKLYKKVEKTSLNVEKQTKMHQLDIK